MTELASVRARSESGLGRIVISPHTTPRIQSFVDGRNSLPDSLLLCIQQHTYIIVVYVQVRKRFQRVPLGFISPDLYGFGFLRCVPVLARKTQ